MMKPKMMVGRESKTKKKHNSYGLKSDGKKGIPEGQKIQNGLDWRDLKDHIIPTPLPTPNLTLKQVV